MKAKGVTIQVKALYECILMVLFVLLLKRVHFLVKGATTQVETLDNYILMIEFVSLLERAQTKPEGVTNEAPNVCYYARRFTEKE